MSLNLLNYLKFSVGISIDMILTNTDSSRNIQGIFEYDKEQLEDDHAFIQWVFPTYRPSAYNDRSPVLTKQEIISIRNSPVIRNILNKFKDKMFNYWGLYDGDNSKLQLLNGHNGLRLSRVIECLTLFRIDVTDIFPMLHEKIKSGVLNPRCEYYTLDSKNVNLPIWIIRYYENLN